jgi:hypothetical protein
VCSLPHDRWRLVILSAVLGAKDLAGSLRMPMFLRYRKNEAALVESDSILGGGWGNQFLFA